MALNLLSTDCICWRQAYYQCSVAQFSFSLAKCKLSLNFGSREALEKEARN